MRLLLVLLFLNVCFSCKGPEAFDLIIFNAAIYTADENNNQTYTAIGIKDGIITQLGNDENLSSLPALQYLDAKNQFLMPGFIEAHGHFMGIGEQLLYLDLMGTESWEQVEEMVIEKAKSTKKGDWIVGRGWHQEKWSTEPSNSVGGYPTHDRISSFTEGIPVMLNHASGHSVFANDAAMKLAGVNVETPDPIGGHIIRNGERKAIGVFEERAEDAINQAYLEYRNGLDDEFIQQEFLKKVSLASEECIRKGISSFQDAGTSIKNLAKFKTLAENGQLDLRLWMMARDSLNLLQKHVKGSKNIGVGSHFYTCSAIKSEVDGALGAFGAWLLAPYHDKADFTGQNTTSIKDVAAIADLALNHDMQLCVHAIGDRANRVVLDLFEGKLTSTLADGKDPRWRIEHAQHLDPADFGRFQELKAIASMQGIHCTSDAPFVEKRLGFERAKTGAYAWRSLLDAGVLIANGTDAPVEDVDPIKNYYASVTRKRIDNGMEFFTEQAMTREEALKSYTIWNAYAAFEEELKGSITEGKFADIVILSNDLRTCSDEEILNTEILYTIIDGKIKYKKD